MKKTLRLLVFGLATFFALNVQAQDEAASSSWSASVDFVSSYLWRGSKFGTGPAIQPGMEFSTGGFAIGAWGSFGTTIDEAPESDIYASYSFDLSESSTLAFTVTDYYFPGADGIDNGSDWGDGTSHGIEPMVSLGLGNLSLTGAYMTGLKENGIDDYYFEVGYTAGAVNLFVGAGDGQYTATASDESKAGDFNLCNIGIGTSKDVKITDSFSFPVSVTGILNPAAERFNVVVAISL